MSEVDTASEKTPYGVRERTNTTTRPSDTVIVRRLRLFLLGLSAFICLGTLVELFFTEHWQQPVQLIPFALALVGLIALVGMILLPYPNSIIVLRVVMVALIGGSLLGMALHVYNNYIFAVEANPNATIGEVALDALTGVNPLMAPGTLAIAGLLALAATYHHPTFSKSV